MKTGFSGSPRTLVPAIVLVLVAIYLFQAVPHGHTFPVHSEPHPPHPAHTDHAHAPADGADGGRSPQDGHHHHSLAQHLDFHSMRPCLGKIVRIAGDAVLTPSAVETAPVALECGIAMAEPTGPLPDDPLPPHAPSRAPPA